MDKKSHHPQTRGNGSAKESSALGGGIAPEKFVAAPANLAAQAAAPKPKVEGNDAVCFTAGLAGAAFGAGVIHAYLAADREPPAVAAGISVGALNAAAMQRVYRELQAATPPGGATSPKEKLDLEAARWRWFRQYVEAMADRPLDIFWDAIPDQSDFFADMIPIRDTSTPEYFQPAEMAARRDRYLLVKLGRWMSRLPVRVSQIASAIVNYVRLREKYPPWEKVKGALALLRTSLVVMTSVILHAFLSPEFFPEHKFQPPAEVAAGRMGVVRRAMHWLRSRVLSWLNMFSLSLVLAGGPLVFLLAYLLKRSGAQQELFSKLNDLGLFLAVTFLLNAATAPFRKNVMQRKVVKERFMPFFAWTFSLLNLLVLSLPVEIGVALYVQEKWSGPAKAAFSWGVVELAVFLALGLVFLLCVPFSPLVILPEPRQWLQENGFLRKWPRPLFGWGTFIFLAINVLSLAGFLGIGLNWIRVQAPSVWETGKGLGLIVGMIVIPITPVFLGVLLVAVRALIQKMIHGTLAVSQRTRLLWTWVEGVGFLALTLALAAIACRGQLLAFVDKVSATPQTYDLFSLCCFLLAASWLFLLLVLFHPGIRTFIVPRVLKRLELSRKLIHDYYLRLWLSKLFERDWQKGPPGNAEEVEKLKDQPFPIVLVVAPLQTLLDDHGQPKSACQLWAKTGAPLVTALRTALAVPKLFEPTRIDFDRKRLVDSKGPVAAGPGDGDQRFGNLRHWLSMDFARHWLGTDFAVKSLDLVDGAVVRGNPLPALFTYLRSNKPLSQRMEDNNDERHPAIHVVYNVPLKGELKAGANPDDIWQKTNVVENGLTSMRLAERRDTQLEVEQTNMVARLETLVRKECGANTGGMETLRVFADEIAPDKDFEFSNSWNPNRKEILEAVAAGCRGTLEVLYKDDLSLQPGAEPPHCPAFMANVVTPRRAGFLSNAPGLPEVCRHCTQQLTRKEAQKKPREHFLEEVLSDSGDLASGQPRIAFVASGGVFRGAFHIGMIASLQLCDIKPDLIIGASVGMLMGGALGATFTYPERQIPARLVDTFLRVDEAVALTRTLKCASRELGLRGRAVKLSPRKIRRMVLRGSRSDPGFAAAGAPPALTDAISDLFMIPYERTKEIAARFISGKVTGAMKLFLDQLRTETIRRLDIERAVIGTSLLEPMARQLLAAELVPFGARQPYMCVDGRKKIALFGMATNLVTQTSARLGGDEMYKDAPYNFVEAALASSAFPAVFAPRQESNVYPGQGDADTLFADGGMFDNLPFFPVIDILSRGQRSFRETPPGRQKTALQFLGDRLEKPDLLLAGALNAVPERKEDARRSFNTIHSITERASSLQDNVKIRAFEYASRRVYDQLKRFHRANPATAQAQHPQHFVDGVVNAGVLPVFPASADHLNGTFAFCKAMNLNADRVCTSIADGCYQSLLALCVEQDKFRRAAEVDRVRDVNDTSEKETDKNDCLTAKSVAALVQIGRIPKVERREAVYYLGGNLCPFFKIELGTEEQRKAARAAARDAETPYEPQTSTYRCPYAREKSEFLGAQMKMVFLACKKDSVHWHEREATVTVPAPPAKPKPPRVEPMAMTAKAGQ